MDHIMKGKRSRKPTSIEDKKKRLIAGNKKHGKVSPRLHIKKSIKGKDQKSKWEKDFPIVAIGASAGGIEAIS
jgi:chemotaxis response regulator CheB